MSQGTFFGSALLVLVIVVLNTYLVQAGNNCAASSGSGQYILLAGFNNYVSSDFGVSFVLVPSFVTVNEWWYGCAIDESGQHMAVGSQLSGLYVSSDFGKSWTKSNASPGSTWGSITSSASGDFMAATYSDAYDYQNRGEVMVSTNSGLTWKQSNAWIFDYGKIVSDKTGQYLGTIAHYFEQTEGILITTDNYGNNWTMVNTAPYDRYYSIAADSSAQHLIITGDKGFHLSSDHGISWNTSAYPVNTTVRYLSCSSTGQYVLAAAAGREVYSSSDYGNSWTVAFHHNDSWTYTANSADFKVLVAITPFQVFVSRDSGASWSSPAMITPSPTSHPTSKK